MKKNQSIIHAIRKTLFCVSNNLLNSRKNDEDNSVSITPKELKPKYDLFIKNLKNDIKVARNSGDKKTWHKLLAEKITFGEYVKIYKESL